MIERELTQKEVRRLFSYNKKTGILKWKVKPARSKINIGDEAGCLDTNGYRTVKIKGKKYYTHRIIWLWIYGYLPKNYIDHKDTIRHHNWLKNLREASNKHNQRNRSNPINNTSGIKGVYRHREKYWRVRMKINGKNKSVGVFKNFDEAVCHRLAVEQCLDWSGCDLTSPAYQYVKENIQNG